jgi:hypothetical protein
MAATMISAIKSPSNRALALCRDATTLALHFDRDTTLGQLAERLGTLAMPHGGLSLSAIQVHLAQSREKKCSGGLAGRRSPSSSILEESSAAHRR